MMSTVETLSIFSRGVWWKLRGLAPYAMIELILPGGSLMALLLWLYRRHRKPSAGPDPLNTLLSDL